MPTLNYFLTRNHAAQLAQEVCDGLRVPPGEKASFTVYQRDPKWKGAPVHFVAIVECGPVGVKCFGPDRYEASFTDSKNTVSSMRASSWPVAVAVLREQLVMMRDQVQKGISIVAGFH